MLIQGRQCTCRDREYAGNPCPLPSTLLPTYICSTAFLCFSQRVWESFFDFFCFSEPCNWDGCTGLLQHTEVWSEPQTTLPGPMNTASLGSTTKWSELQGISASRSKLALAVCFPPSAAAALLELPLPFNSHLPHLLTFISNHSRSI